MDRQSVHIAIPEYGQLPAAGLLDALSTAHGTEETVFTVSGYGLSFSTNVKDALPNLSFRERLMAQSTLVNLGSHMTDGFNLQTQGNGDGRDGTCSGNIWQRNYYEHILRDQADTKRIAGYILDYLVNWDQNEENPQNQPG